MVVAGGDDQEAIYLALAEQPRQLALARWILVGAARDQQQATLACHLLCPARDRGVERVRDVLDHEAEHPQALPTPKGARDVVAAEAELSDRLSHTLGRLGRDTRFR